MAHGPGEWIHAGCIDEDRERDVMPPGWTAKKAMPCRRCGEMIEIGDDASKVHPKMTFETRPEPRPEPQMVLRDFG